jgi:predicted anti-sigma-YlaC factor YlaD
MNDQWTDRLSNYLDGELNVAERAELEEHLSSCAECSAVLEQLRQVVARAQSLENRAPDSDLWSGVAERIGAAAAVADLDEHRQRKQERLGQRRYSISLPQLVAASVALMVLSGGSAWVVSKAGGAAGEGAMPTATNGTALVSEAPADLATSYDAAVVQLELILKESRSQLDTATVRIIEENLSIIDRAIAQAQRALAMDPASIYLQEHLAATKRQKLEFLRQAALMAGAVS